MNYSRDNQELRNPPGNAGFRLLGVDRLPVMAQEEVCPIIKQYLDYLEDALAGHGDSVDIDTLQEMLREISRLMRSGKSRIRSDGYLRMLNRLTRIYTQGLRVENDRAYAGTAANFADILQSVSQEFQDYDYHPSVSLLLHYVDKLFKNREQSWIEVYDHLHSMPDSIHFMQQLRLEHLNEINRWIEEGVENLHTLLDEQLEVLSMQDQALSELELQILGRLYSTSSVDLPNVVDFKLALKLRELRHLSEQWEELKQERCTKLGIIDLLESNIREFSDRLAHTRRSTLLKLVWSSPDLPSGLQ